jgi:molybdopterin/thiamine biosynthesis adenylyltransferase
LEWPHIEENGVLCLLDDVRIAKPEMSASILGTLLADAVRLIRESESEVNQSDFQREFHSYWDRQPSLSDESVYSLLYPHGPSRFVRFWAGKQFTVIGESEDQVLNWLKRRYNKKADFRATSHACLLWLDVPLVPKKYPRSAADLYQIATQLEGGTNLLRQLAAGSEPPFNFIIGASSENGPCFAAVRSRRPRHVDIRGKETYRSLPGFRLNKAPMLLQTQHMFSTSAPVDCMEVDRIDAAWIHGRDHDPRQQTLHARHVLIAGCGSIGAPLAQQLAMAGVGRQTLIDDDLLSWPNVGRHPLGATSVGKKKSLALAAVLQENYPHLVIEGFDGKLDAYLQRNSEAPSADLIVCATADWPSERLLNLQHVCGEVIAPLLYTWTEAYACAGHAVFLPGVQPCLQCGFTATGDLRSPVTAWPPQALNNLSEPACSARFQPYGPVELAGTVSIAASLTLDVLLGKVSSIFHRVWAGPRSLLEDAGGTWDNRWLAEHPSSIDGAFQEDLPWPDDTVCAVCGNQPQLRPKLQPLFSPLANPDSAS